MTHNRILAKNSTLLLLTGLFLLALSNAGCAGDRIEYDPPDPELVGKVIRFKEPMVYIDFSDKENAKKFGFDYAQYEGEKIVRQLVTKYRAYNPNGYLLQFPKENVKMGIAFAILGTYWVRHGFIRREFAPEYQEIILRDENDILSVYGFDLLERQSDFSEN